MQSTDGFYLDNATNESTTRTSTNTPTTVANAAREFSPNKLMATASSNKLDVPIWRSRLGSANSLAKGSAKRAQKEEIKNRDQHQNQTVEFDSRAVFVANLRVGLLQLTTIKTIT